MKTTGGVARLLAILLLLACNLAQAEAGRVIFVSGEASLIRGGTLPLTKGTVLEAGDILVTGPDGRVQMLMADGDRIALRPDTRFGIDDFRGDPGQPVVAGAPRPSGWRSFYSLVKGGFRTLTKTVGPRDVGNYRVRTPVATIGIRGCDYGVVMCEGNCGNGPDGTPIQSKLIVGVTEGQVNVNTQGGDVDLGNYQSTIIVDASAKPEKTEGIPEDLIDSNPNTAGEGDGSLGANSGGGDGSNPPSGEGGSGGTGGAGGSEGGGFTSTDVGSTGGPAIQINGQDGSGSTTNLTGGTSTPAQTIRGFAVATGPLGAVAAFNSTGVQASSSYATDGAGRLTAFNSVAPASTQPARYALGSASNVNDGYDAVTGLRWGRWAGGQANVTPQGGSTSSVDLTNSSLHWIYGPDLSSGPALPISGTKTYDLVGNTNPTDNHGNTGFLGSASFQADFTNQTVHSDVNVGINNQAWNASGNGGFGPGGTFAGGYDASHGGSVTVTDSSTCSNGCSGSGNFSGFFTNSADGAGMGYTMQEGGSTTVSGAAAFGNPH